jgi:hypothetical protein
MERYEPKHIFRWIDAFIAETTNPHHLAILRNYRRHGIFEVTGNWQWILTPEMTVDHPHYRINLGGDTLVLDGREAVGDFYEGLKQTGLMSTFGPIREQFLVGDWGLASHGLWGHQIPGAVAIEQGHTVDDPDAFYNVTVLQATVWHYTPDAKLIGEHIFEDTGSRTIEKLDPADVLTPAEAMEPIEKLLADELEREPLPIAR